MLRTTLFAVFSIVIGLLLTPSLNGEIVMTITDDGTDLTMRATGTYDMSAVTLERTMGLGASAAVAPTIQDGLFGWETGFPDSYVVNFSGRLTGSANALNPTSATVNTPFFVVQDTLSGIAHINFEIDTNPIGTVDETAVFAGTTLASLGMVAGETVTVSWAGDFATITTGVVPEPSSLMLTAVGMMAVLIRRRRRTAIGT